MPKKLNKIQKLMSYANAKKTPLHFSELGKKMALPALTIRGNHGKKSTVKTPAS